MRFLRWRRRLVRLQLIDPLPPVEGILVGRGAGHYHLLKPVVFENPDRSHSLDGEVFVPHERVVLIQRLP